LLNSGDARRTLSGVTSIMVMQGRELDGADLGLILGLLGEHPKWCRSQFSVELCHRGDWRNAQDRIKDMAARTLLQAGIPQDGVIES